MNLGRLKATKAQGDTAGNQVVKEIYTIGARSFSIRDTSGNLIWDSGDQFEQITAAINPAFFNSNHEINKFDDRSDDKGPEPEGVAVGKAFGRTDAFIGLERIGGVMVYDVSNPTVPEFVQTRKRVGKRGLPLDEMEHFGMRFSSSSVGE